MVGACRTAWLVPLAALAACAGTPDGVESPPRETSLTRFYADRVTADDLAASRNGALACAHALALVDRELREPWAEDRDGRLLVEQLRVRHPSLFSLACEAWLGAEPPDGGAGRRMFCELGVYRAIRPAGVILAHASPDCMEAWVERLLRARDDSTAGRILPGWRHAAPEVIERGPNYLASAWQFSIATDTQLRLHDSLLGPFQRCTVADAGSISALGPMQPLDGFDMPAEIAEAVSPGPAKPLAGLVESLIGAAGLPARFRLAPGPIERGDEGRDFLSAALRGMKEGGCDLEFLPAGTSALRLTFSYLLGLNEARASFALRREGLAGWIIEEATYEPAGASMVSSRGATLDLMPLLRARHGT